MSTNAFLADERDIKFVLFEHLNIERLFELEYYQEHDRSMVEAMLDMALTFCSEVLGPLNRSADLEGVHFDPETHSVTTPKGTKEAWDAFVETGFSLADVSMEQGGIQAPRLLGVCMAELTSGSNPAFTMYPGLTRTAAHLVRTHGSDWMKEVVLPRLENGQWSGTMCLTEPAVGTAVGDLLTTAKRNGDSYLINGTKQWVSGGDHDLTDNIIHLLLARVEGAPKGIKGVSMFLVSKHRLDQKTGDIQGENDVKCVGIEHKMGIHGNSTCLLQFGDDEACEGYLIGEENRGIEYMFLMMNEARIGVGIQSLGQAAVAFLNALEYTKTRVQGTDVEKFKDVDAPRVPIISHPDVRRMLMQQRAIVEGGRALCYQAGMYADIAEHGAGEDDRMEARGYLELMTPIVKAWCSDMGYNSVVTSIQTYGGYGYTRDYPVEQIARDLKITSIYEGTNGIQALDLVGRKMRMQGGMLFMGFVAALTEFGDKGANFPAMKEDFDAYSAAVGDLTETAMAIAGFGMAGDQAGAVLNAYPFMMGFGHVMVARLLLEQATIASQKLEGEVTEADGRFYRNKIRTARFFVQNILPEAKANFEIVRTLDRSPLEFEYEL